MLKMPLAPNTSVDEPTVRPGPAMRTSSYTVYVDLPDNRDEMLLVHGYSGAYDKVSRRVATYLRSLDTVKPPRPLYGAWSPEPPVEGQVAPPSEATIGVLKRRGYLTDMTVEQEVAYFSKVANNLHALSNRPSYIFMPTYDCNLRCGYCFQDHMRTDPRYRPLLRVMRREMIDRIFAAMPRIEEHHGLLPGPVRRRGMGFFGGEPFLAQSRPAVEYIINKAQADGDTTFWAITNGTELDAYRDLLGPDKINWVQITLDGPPREHDRRRIYADGRGSFERIARNLTMALEQGTSVSVRMNVDRTNIGQLPELADELVARGWSRYETFSAYTAVIAAYGDNVDTKTTFSSWELDQALDRLREQHPNMGIIRRPDDPLASRVQAIFTSQGRPDLNATYCNAHNGMYLFDSFGDMYACWDRTGDSNIRIGSIAADGRLELDDTNARMWRSRNVTTNPICRQCRYALYCGGGCAVLALNYRGEFFTNYCDGFAARFRSSVADAYGKHVSGGDTAVTVSPGCDQ